MKITRESFKNIVRETMIEENEYQEFFKRALEKTGKSIPDMSDEEKKAFFNKIDSAWDAKGEKNEELTGNQHKLDVDGDGEIEASDLAALRAGKTNEAMASGPWVGLEKTPKGPKLVKTFKSGNEAKAWVMKSPGGHSIMTKKDWDVSEGKSEVEGVNEAKYPTSLYVNSIIYGQGFTGLKGIEGGKYYKVVEMDDTTATLAPCDQKGKITGSKKVRHKLSSLEGSIKTAKRGDENGIVIESVNEAGDKRFDWPPVLDKFNTKEIQKLEAEYKTSLDKSSAILKKQWELINKGYPSDFPWENYDKWPAKLKAEVAKLTQELEKSRAKQPEMFKKLMQARGTWR